MNRYKFLIICFSIILSFAVQNLAQTEVVSAELIKLKETRNNLKPSDDNAAFDTQFKDLEQDLEAKRLFSALYKLQFLWIGLATNYYYEKQSEIVQDKLPLLEIEWNKVGKDITAKEKKFSLVAMNRIPAMARAIIHSTRYRVRPYYISSILYGKNTNPNQGLYYIGNSQANIDLALFYQSLRFSKAKPASKFVSLDKELDQLEREIIEAYRTSSPDDQSRYNALNSTLKLAQELNAKSWYDGALLKYLDTVLVFGMLKKIETNPTEFSATKQKIEAQITTLTKDKFDQSIGLTFLELAQSYSANEANSKRVKVILDEVIPKYQTYLSNLKTGGNK